MVARVNGFVAGIAVCVPATSPTPCNVERRLANDPGASAAAIAWVRDHCPCARCAAARAAGRPLFQEEL